jgi:hypothetical protein
VHDHRHLLSVRRLAHSVLLVSLLKTLHGKRMMANVDKLYAEADSLTDGLDVFSDAARNGRGAL